MKKEMPKLRFNTPVNGKYVLPEHALILKELGFDWPTKAYYFKEFADKDKLTLRILYNPNNHNDPEYNQTDFYSAPTIHIAARWLRENGIFVEVLMRRPDWFEVVGKYFDENATIQVKYLFDLWDVDEGLVFPSYEVGLLYGVGMSLLKLKQRKDGMGKEN